MAEKKPRVGFVGLGAMGLPMAQNLAKRLSVPVTVSDVNQKVLAGAAAWGGVVAPSPAAVAAASDVVFAMLPDDAIVRTVALGKDGVIEGAHPGLVFVDVSTIGPWTMREVAEALGAKGVEAFGAAATLGVAAAKEGRLGIFVDDFSPSFALVEPLIQGYAKTIMRTGGLASSKVVKLVNNMMVGMNVAITAEAIALAGKAGIPAETIVKLIRKGSGDSYALANHFEKNALSGNVGKGLFPTSYIMKDMRLGSELARRHRIPAAFAALSLAVYRGTCALGHKDHYYPLALRWMERAANMPALTPDPKE